MYFFSNQVHGLLKFSVHPRMRTPGRTRRHFLRCYEETRQKIRIVRSIEVYLLGFHLSKLEDFVWGKKFGAS